ncbi:MAG: NADH:flavin oxidoreductase/NADH oxidase [Caulobacteraceae bacterium]|jgi:N-ethylmaleimide reductase|nr:NADH:flavin oxidoreductase/NADH oxidase [Caulobacteraceae bacterium]
MGRVTSRKAETITTGAGLLFSPYRLNGLVLPNRIVMAPMTRSRARQPGDIPTNLNALYYSQRAGAGLIITEATQISQEGRGYAWTPGIRTEAQRDGWRLVTDAVHRAGGRIFLQLWHVGRVSLASMQPGGGPPVAPSALRARNTRVFAIGADGLPGMIATDAPRALETAEIGRVVDDYRRAAGLARQAGFDGVEIHGGNGYLVDQFLRTTTNLRTDRYGGSTDNRIRFLAEVARAVAAEVGATRTGVRLAPYITFKDMADPEIVDTILAAAEMLADQEIAYIHLAEADWDDAPVVPESFREALRARFANTIIVAGRYDPARASRILDAGHADLVAFGRPFVANPDLPRRFRLGLPLAQFDAATLFGGGVAGYTDYPVFDDKTD